MMGLVRLLLVGIIGVVKVKGIDITGKNVNVTEISGASFDTSLYAPTHVECPSNLTIRHPKVSSTNDIRAVESY